MSLKNDKYSINEQSFTTSENQNYNLNQNKICPILVPVHSYSKPNNDEHCATDFTVSDKYQEKEKLHLWNKFFKASAFTTLNKDNTGLKQRWKNENTLKTTNKSTLSLHIAAYESSNDAAASGDENVLGWKNEKFGKIKTSNQCFTDSLKCRNPFEFLRQQSEDQRSEPEVMQFSASQRLIGSQSSALSEQIENNGEQFVQPEMPPGASTTALNISNMTAVASSIIEKFETVDNPTEKAAKIKDEANKFFKDEKYDVAIELYTAAINLDPLQPTYYGNRSIANLRKELFGSALTDANEAIKLDPAYVKAYFRRASANMALGKYKLALKDYESVRKFRPNDTDAQKKFEECSKIVKRIAFEKAIACDHDEKKLLDSIKPDDFAVESTYTGPRLDGEVTVEFMKDLIAHFKAEKKLPIRYAYKMILAAYDFFKVQDSLIHITVPDKQKFTICGDIHGQFYDLINLFEINGLPSEKNPYLFNGDFVDRGSFSVETIFTLLGWKLLYPNHFYMSRGNHESDSLNKMYGFEGEVKAKYNAKMSEVFTELFNQLPLVHVINKKILCCHGGLSADENVTLEQLRKLHRTRQPPEDGPMCGLLWSDPQDENGISVSKRGAGIQWGPDITKKFLENNDLLYIVRSHEVKPEGYEKHHGGLVYTIFSAPNYCDTIGNKGAFINITGDNLFPPKITSFEAVPHPRVKPMAYGSSLFNFLS